MKKYEIALVFIGMFLTAPFAVFANYLLPVSSSSLPAAVGDISQVSGGTISNFYGWILVFVGVPFAFYLAESLSELIDMNTGSRVRHITRLAAYIDRRRQEKIRENWERDLVADLNEEDLAQKNEMYAGQIDNSRILKKEL